MGCCGQVGLPVLTSAPRQPPRRPGHPGTGPARPHHPGTAMAASPSVILEALGSRHASCTGPTVLPPQGMRSSRGSQ